ncbi:MAG: hypothetical protein NFCOHLIN_02962 [Gammaproteobacteria bacterium]|nr:hypothetical protein [Gammaproteobacteria bacterium]
MTGLVLGILFFARPIMFVDAQYAFGGLNLFEILTIALTFLLVILAAVNALRGNGIRLSPIDIAIIMLVAWCSTVALVYPENTDFKAYVKLVLPPITFMVLKRAIATQRQYVRLLRLMIIGFAIPVALSAYAIHEGTGLAARIFWTGLERYSGVYNGIHTMGHNMGFLIMSVCVYLMLCDENVKASITRLTMMCFLPVLCGAALYCLFHGQVRTVYVGLFVFLSIVLVQYSTRWFIFFAGAVILSVAMFASIYSTVFFDVVDVFSGHRDIKEAGSGRPLIWQHNLRIFANLPIDQKIAGVGIGNYLTDPFRDIDAADKITSEHVWNSHNDYLEMLMEIGVIGLLLTMWLYAVIAKRVLQIERRARIVFLGLLVAVGVMNVLSNSYIARFGLAQMFFMVLTYIDIPLQRRMPTESAKAPLFRMT